MRPGNRPPGGAYLATRPGNRIGGALHSDAAQLARVAAVKVEQVSAIAAIEGGLPPSGSITVTANYAIGADDYLVLVDATAGPVTITLPDAFESREVVVKKIDASGNAVTVDGLGVQQIDGSANYPLPAQNDSVRLRAPGGGTEWFQT